MSEHSKLCCQCKLVKGFDHFCSDKSQSDGRNRRCKSCDNKRGKSYYELKCEADPGYYRKQHLKQRFGITVEDYDRMLDSQNGVCAICYRPEFKKNATRLSVDHDHVTGKIRALLCDRCNKAIGLMEDNPEMLIAAANYLGELT